MYNKLAQVFTAKVVWAVVRFFVKVLAGTVLLVASNEVVRACTFAVLILTAVADLVQEATAHSDLESERTLNAIASEPKQRRAL